MSFELIFVTSNIFLYFQVQPKHVKEAFRLLNKSIIRVEQPDIHLEEDEAPEPMDMEGKSLKSLKHCVVYVAMMKYIYPTFAASTREPALAQRWGRFSTFLWMSEPQKLF